MRVKPVTAHLVEQHREKKVQLIEATALHQRKICWQNARDLQNYSIAIAIVARIAGEAFERFARSLHSAVGVVFVKKSWKHFDGLIARSETSKEIDRVKKMHQPSENEKKTENIQAEMRFRSIRQLKHRTREPGNSQDLAFIND